MRIKKTSITTPTTAQVVNSYSESQEEAYSADYINGLNTYSTTEHIIGTWIDNKPIYEKTFVVLNSGGQSITHNISNVDKIWVNYSASFSIEKQNEPNPWMFSQSIWDVGGMITYKRFQVILNRTTMLLNTTDENNYDWYITVRYTKTTDTVS